jgi:hypothetical protein
VNHRGLEVLVLAYTVARLSDLERATLAVLGGHADRQGRTFISEALMSARTSRSTRSLRRALRRLEARGLIHVQRHGQHRPNQYTLAVDRLRLLRDAEVQTGHGVRSERVQTGHGVRSDGIQTGQIEPPDRPNRTARPVTVSAYLRSRNLRKTSADLPEGLHPTGPESENGAGPRTFRGGEPSRVADDPTLAAIMRRRDELRRAKGYPA